MKFLIMLSALLLMSSVYSNEFKSGDYLLDDIDSGQSFFNFEEITNENIVKGIEKMAAKDFSNFKSLVFFKITPTFAQILTHFSFITLNDSTTLCCFVNLYHRDMLPDTFLCGKVEKADHENVWNMYSYPESEYSGTLKYLP